MWLKLSVAALALTLVAGQDDLVCYEAGECTGSTVVGYAGTDNAKDCLQTCKDTLGCFFFTFYDDSGFCLFMENCANLTTAGCDDCISGDVECDIFQCDMAGFCSGAELVDIGVTATQQGCIDACDDEADCFWWSYDTVENFCVLTKDCPNIDTSYTDTLSGEKGCEVKPDGPLPAEGVPKLVIIGGMAYNESEKILLLDANGTMTSCPAGVDDFPMEVYNHGAFNLDDSILVCGGESGGVSQSGCWKLDNGTSWVNDINMTESRADFAGFIWNDGSIWMTGGANEVGILLASTEEYNGTDFVAGPLLPSVLESHCIVKATENFLIVTGGSDGQDYHRRSAMVYQVDTDSWSFLDSMTDGRAGHSCQVVSSSRGQELVVAGGGTDPTSVDVFSFSSLSWRIGTNLPKPIMQASTVEYEDTFLLIGGTDGEGAFYDTVYEYNVENETWDERADLKLPSGRYGHASVIMDADDLWCFIPQPA